MANGDNSDYAACDEADFAGQLCDDETPLVDTTGNPIPDLTNGGTTLIGQNDYESIHSQSWGGSLQFTSNATLFGFGNAFGTGATVDASTTRFNSGTWLGPLNSSLTVLPSPYFVDTPENSASAATPVNLDATNKYYGFYVTDTVDVTARLSATVAARYNVAKIDLTDLRGDLLSGNNRFTHFNPSAGVTYRVSPFLTVYGSYAINNRTPDHERDRVLGSRTAMPPALQPGGRSPESQTSRGALHGTRSARPLVRRRSGPIHLERQPISNRRRERYLWRSDQRQHRLLPKHRRHPAAGSGDLA